MSVLLWTSGELIAHFNVSRVTLHRWRTQPHFPKPIRDLGPHRGSLWDAREVVAWDQDRREGTWLATLREWRDTGDLEAAGRAGRVTAKQAKRRLRRVGELP